MNDEKKIKQIAVFRGNEVELYEVAEECYSEILALDDNIFQLYKDNNLVGYIRAENYHVVLF